MTSLPLPGRRLLKVPRLDLKKKIFGHFSTPFKPIAQTLQKMMTLPLLEEVHLSFYLAVIKIITDKAQNIFLCNN